MTPAIAHQSPSSPATLRYLGHYYQSEAWIALAVGRTEDAARAQALADQAWAEHDLREAS